MKLSVTLVFIILLFSFGTCQSQKKNLPPPLTADSVYTFATPSADGIGKLYLGREISHVMGAAGAAWLERNNRQQEENTKLAIEKMGLSSQSVVADIGAGTGYYTFLIARKVPREKCMPSRYKMK